MHQKDFSKIKEMNICSDVIFANQADVTSYEETEFDGHHARMITTATRGVGVNRNLALTYADAEICLFADDDVCYIDDLEQKILLEFDAHPDADIIIFHLDTYDELRMQKKYPRTRRCHAWERMPWGGIRIAVRLNSIKKANVWFTTLFGGGCLFPSGEDSMWLREAKRKGLTFYVSKECIGKISFDTSSWFTGYDERFFFGKGAFYEAAHKRTVYVWMTYFWIRTIKSGSIKLSDRWKWMQHGRKAYRMMMSFNDYVETYLDNQG